MLSQQSPNPSADQVDDLQDVMRNWSVFAQPSLEEAFGIPVLQTISCGIHIVASYVGGLPELVVPEVT
jgi:glycosyltransferase involved in cell wall biosynthesis